MEDHICEAVAQLAKSGRGRNAMRHLLCWLDDDGLGLDTANQDAVIALLELAWGGWAGSVRDVMRDRIEMRCEHDVLDGDFCEKCNKAYKDARREAEQEAYGVCLAMVETCPLCAGTGKNRDAQQAWDIPGAPVPECHYCKDARAFVEDKQRSHG